MQFKKLNHEDVGYKGNGWHFYTPDKEIGYASRKEDSKVNVSKEMQRTLLPGIGKVCAIQYFYNKLAICAVPENGGTYLMIKNNASVEDVKNLSNDDALKNIILENIN
ncbi:MAG: hypothetical protein ABH828_04560 [archaeon]